MTKWNNLIRDPKEQRADELQEKYGDIPLKISMPEFAPEGCAVVFKVTSGGAGFYVKDPADVYFGTNEIAVRLFAMPDGTLHWEEIERYYD